MAQTIRLTLTPDLEKAINILRHSTTGTLNTTELIKLAVGELAQLKKRQLLKPNEMTLQEMDKVGARLFFEWAKEDGSLEVDNIAHPEKLKPYKAKEHVRTH
ncbi:MAG: hypothetical protein ACR2LN_04235 [Candidatus Levyibacteriota bacterium]